MLELFVVTLSALYWLPFMLAAGREHHLLLPIMIANGLVGWTGAGWLMVLGWVLLSPAKALPPPRRTHLEVVRA